MNPNTIADLNTATTVCKEQINIILQKKEKKKRKKNNYKHKTLKQFTGMYDFQLRFYTRSESVIGIKCQICNSSARSG